MCNVIVAFKDNRIDNRNDWIIIEIKNVMNLIIKILNNLESGFTINECLYYSKKRNCSCRKLTLFVFFSWRKILKLLNNRQKRFLLAYKQ